MPGKPDHLRWTETPAEAAAIATYNERVLPLIFQDVLIQMVDGRVLRGNLQPTSVGNNGGADGGWRYYAGITLQTEAGGLHLDYLDVKSVAKA